MNTLKVTTVYGDVFLIDRKAYENGAKLIPIYTKNGKMKLWQYHQKMGFKNRGNLEFLHRGNIKTVQPFDGLTYVALME